MREGRMRSFLAMLFLSQGVPMLTGGDELGRTQGGNNNAYCQDNEVSWCDWNLDDRARRLLEFTRRLIRLRRRHPELRRRKFFQGRPLCAAGMKDLAWLRPDGGEMADAEWRAVALPAFGFRLCGEAMDEVDERGEPITGDTLLVLMNAHDLPVPFTLPDPHPGLDWEVLIDTGEAGTGGRAGQGAKLTVPPKALVLLRAARA
jgi:glycogen operon protein